MDELFYEEKRNEIFQLNSLLTQVERYETAIKADGMSRNLVPALESLDGDIFTGFNTKRFTELPSQTHMNVALEALNATRVSILIGIIGAGVALLVKLYEWLLDYVLKVPTVENEKVAKHMKGVYRSIALAEKNGYEEPDYVNKEEQSDADRFIARHAKSKPSVNRLIYRIAALIGPDGISLTDAEKMLLSLNNAISSCGVQQGSLEAAILSHMLINKELVPKSVLLLNIPGARTNCPMSPALLTNVRDVVMSTKQLTREIQHAYSKLTRIRTFPVDPDVDVKRVNADVLRTPQFRGASGAINDLSMVYKMVNDTLTRIVDVNRWVVGEAVLEADTSPGDPEYLHVSSWNLDLDPKLEVFSENLEEFSQEYYGFEHFVDTDKTVIPFGREFGIVLSAMANESTLLKMVELGAREHTRTEEIRKEAEATLAELKNLQGTIKTYSRETAKVDNIMNYEVPVWGDGVFTNPPGFIQAGKVINGMVKSLDALSKPIRKVSVVSNRYYRSYQSFVKLALTALSSETK